MKKFYNALFVLLISILAIPAFAQEESSDENAISEEDLKRFAIVEDSADVLKASVISAIEEMVKGTEAMTASRYNELYRYSDKPEKLAEKEATEEEVEFLTQVDQLKDSMTTEIKEWYVDRAKNYVGASKFNQIRKSIREDMDLREQYKNILAEVEAMREESIEEAAMTEEEDGADTNK